MVHADKDFHYRNVSSIIHLHMLHITHRVINHSI